LSPGQGDVRAFEAFMRSGALCHSGEKEIFNVEHETKWAGFKKNTASVWRMGSHDSFEAVRYTDPEMKPNAL